MTQAIEKPPKKFTGAKALMWIIVFFAIIFAVNGLMAFFALSTFGGLETNNPYRKGLFYNNQIAAAANQKKSGWEISLNHIPTAITGDKLRVKVTWPDGDLPPKKVVAVITRGVTNAYDQRITLDRRKRNLWDRQIILPLAGEWNVDILVYRPNGAQYQLTESIFVAAGK